MNRPAVPMPLGGRNGIWLEMSVARRYAAVVGKLLATERRRHPDAVPPLDLLLSQFVISSASGTDLVPKATGDGDSSWVKGSSTEGRCAREQLLVGEAAEQIGCSPRAVRKAISDGRLSAEKVGRDWLIGQTELQDFERKRAARNGSSD
ncbi:excisionase family DNA-binding protein [Kribbella sp. NBC_00482]|uniref:excisionase family DNA-binding protein n=1 Tax=Kribbella sp. NBC_00482 TaxID=2975968 RepID=UPI002E19D987